MARVLGNRQSRALKSHRLLCTFSPPLHGPNPDTSAAQFTRFCSTRVRLPGIRSDSATATYQKSGKLLNFSVLQFYYLRYGIIVPTSKDSFENKRRSHTQTFRAMAGIVSTPQSLALTIVITALKLLTKFPSWKMQGSILSPSQAPAVPLRCAPYSSPPKKGSSSVVPGVLGLASPKGLNRAALGSGERQR